MSQENVEIVLGVQPGPEVDCVALFRDEKSWKEWADATRPIIHPDAKCVFHEFGNEKSYVGLNGIRDFMLDWMAPWVAYRIEMEEEAIDLGDRVLILNHDCGRRSGSEQEVRGHVGVVWTIRHGKVARLDAYMTRDDALKAVGLAE
jgi:ketosteroid isomerase-like protein